MVSPLQLDERALAAKIRQLANGRGCTINRDLGTSLEVFWIDENRLRDWNDTPDLFHVVWLSDRPDCMRLQAFDQHLEHTYFKPSTPANDNFRLTYFKWQDCLWHVITVPLSCKKYCYAAAKQTSCRLADGFPQIITGGAAAANIVNLRDEELRRLPTGILGPTVARFPLNNKNTFTLEPIHSHGGPAIGLFSLPT